MANTAKKIEVTAKPIMSDVQREQLKALKALEASTRPATVRYGKTVVALTGATGEENLAKQARGVLAALRSAKNGRCSETELCALLDPPNGSTVGKFIETKQTGHRIYTFYRGQLIQKGFIRTE